MPSAKCYVISRVVLVADLTEDVNSNQVKRAAEVAGEIWSEDIMEMYSPERVAALCTKHGLAAGCSLDLTNGFGFNTAEDRRRAWQILKNRDAPLWVIGSLPRNYWKMLQSLKQKTPQQT